MKLDTSLAASRLVWAGLLIDLVESQSHIVEVVQVDDDDDESQRGERRRQKGEETTGSKSVSYPLSSNLQPESPGWIDVLLTFRARGERIAFPFEP